MKMRPALATGFTLVELIITVLVIGILMIMLAPIMASFLTASANNYTEQAAIDNQHVADALVAVSRNEGYGVLAAPYSGAGYVSTIYNPNDASVIGAAFKSALVDAGVSPVAVNDDGTQSHNVRVYQRVAGLSQVMPLYFRSGPLVTLTYDYGVIYLTRCPLADTGCRNGAGIPGASPALTAGNRNSWTAVYPDMAATFVSSLPVQTTMLSATTRRLDRVRDALLSYFRGKQLAAQPTDTTNWYPGSGMGGKSPTANQGCRDGWYPLDTTTVLPLIGLSVGEFGKTSWGGVIEYCRDFDPAASKSANAPPQAAALRFNANISAGAVPDPSVLANNVILTL